MPKGTTLQVLFPRVSVAHLREFLAHEASTEVFTLKKCVQHRKQEPRGFIYCMQYLRNVLC